jgi:hypothetical protein
VTGRIYDPFTLNLDHVAWPHSPQKALQFLLGHAQRLEIACGAKLNDVHITAFPRDSLDELEHRYFDGLKWMREQPKV